MRTALVKHILYVHTVGNLRYILRSGGRTLAMLIPVLTPATILVVHIAPYGVVYLPASLQGKVGMKIQYCIEPF